MNSSIRILTAAACVFGAAGSARATLATWQTAVGTGTAPAATLFSTVNGAAPVIFDVGALSGDRSLEFIYNATGGGASQALIGSQNGAAGAQGLKVNQWNNTGMYGVTDFGVADHTSPVGYLLDQDVHIVFTSDGLDTIMYLNGAPSHTFGGVDLTITGSNAIGAAVNAAGVAYFDNLLGSVLGFASYDSALSPAEVSAHFNAFVVPEPGTTGLALLAGLAAVARRRRA